MLSSWSLDRSSCDEATIVELTSELVTNAIQHAARAATGGREFAIVMTLERGMKRGMESGGDGVVVRLEVHDQDPTPPRRRAPDWAAESGRGLLLVEAQAHQWGTVASANGKYVWFSMTCSYGSPERSPLPGLVPATAQRTPPTVTKESSVCPPLSSPTTSSVPAPTV